MEIIWKLFNKQNLQFWIQRFKNHSIIILKNLNLQLKIMEVWNMDNRKIIYISGTNKNQPRDNMTTIARKNDPKLLDLAISFALKFWL